VIRVTGPLSYRSYSYLSSRDLIFSFFSHSLCSGYFSSSNFLF